MVVEIEGVRILTDPGSFTEGSVEQLTSIHAVLITHEHQDHMHIPSIKGVLATNPTALVICNQAVAKIIEEQIADTVTTVVGDGQHTDVKGVSIEGFGSEHALVYPPNVGLCENTGYLIDERFYFPGDNFYNPNKQIDILALPVAGPWMKIAEAVDFAKLIKPRVAFGVHDGMVQPFFRGYVGMILKNAVPEVEYVALKDGETRDF